MRKPAHGPDCIACTDPDRLAAWLRIQHAEADSLAARSRELRGQAEIADESALQAVIQSAGAAVIRGTQHDQQRLHGQANYYAERALLVRAHAREVVDAHPPADRQLSLGAAPAVQDSPEAHLHVRRPVGPSTAETMPDGS